MGNINTSVISGNLTRDPENVGKDTPVVKFGVAVNRSYKPKDSEDYVEEVSFIDVTVFGNFGGLVARKLRKGDSATVMGRLKQETWETDDGKRSKVVLIAEQIDSEGFFRSKDEENAPGGSAASETPATDAPAAPAADDDIPF